MFICPSPNKNVQRGLAFGANKTPPFHLTSFGDIVGIPTPAIPWGVLPRPQDLVVQGAAAEPLELEGGDPGVVDRELGKDAGALPDDDLLVHVAGAAGDEDALGEVGAAGAQALLLIVVVGAGSFILLL